MKLLEGEAAISFEDSASSMGTAEKHASHDASLVTMLSTLATWRRPSNAWSSSFMHVSWAPRPRKTWTASLFIVEIACILLQSVV